MKKNWKTTTTGILGAVLIIGYGLYTGHLDGAMIIEALSVAGIGAFSKDHNVTHSIQP